MDNNSNGYWDASSPYSAENQNAGQYSQNPVYSQQFGTATAPAKPPKKKSNAGLVVLCIVLSLIFGFGGAALATFVFDDGTRSNTASDAGLSTASEHSLVTTSIESLSDLVALTQDSVVEITTESVSTSSIFGQYVTEGAGSGVIVRSDGYIVTNNHVTSGARNIVVTLSDGSSYDATLVGSDSKTDLAVIKIDANNLTPAVMGESSEVSVGDRVIAIGNPLGSLGGTVTDGIISALDREIEVSGQSMTLLQTSAAVNPGNSGGGLFNAYGELVGIVNAKPSSSSSTTTIEGLAFAIPVDTVKEVVSSIIETGYVTGRVVMGISVYEISTQQEAMQYNVNRYGVYIVSITEGGGADRAGLQVGDCIISINGNVVDTSSDITSVLDESGIGDTVEVQVIREGS
ncbi:MAG: trypsin-like peptidase domain-containing protein, partial [Oscillospiraceae bacterium]|nr:trypsin-like peptidase domain-containing protein [Oscillospiraceae bacterium]